MVFAIDTDGDSQRTPEWRSLSDLDLGPKNQPVLIKVAQQGRISIADLPDPAALALSHVSQSAIVVDGDIALLGRDGLAMGPHRRKTEGSIDAVFEIL